MDVYNFVEAYILTGQKIDALWNFFVTVHLAIAGFLFYAKPKKEHSVAICVLVVAYLAFSSINYRAKALEYGFLNSLTEEIRTQDTTSLLVNEYFDTLSFDDRSTINVVIHLSSFAFIVIIFILSHHKRPKRKIDD